MFEKGLEEENPQIEGHPRKKFEEGYAKNGKEMERKENAYQF